MTPTIAHRKPGQAIRSIRERSQSLKAVSAALDGKEVENVILVSLTIAVDAAICADYTRAEFMKLVRSFTRSQKDWKPAAGGKPR